MIPVNDLGVRLATLSSVREHCENMPVELWLRHDGRIVVRAYNECGNNFTDIDFSELLSWVKEQTQELEAWFG